VIQTNLCAALVDIPSRARHRLCGRLPAERILAYRKETLGKNIDFDQSLILLEPVISSLQGALLSMNPMRKLLILLEPMTSSLQGAQRCFP
jgi:hypothetical protein